MGKFGSRPEAQNVRKERIKKEIEAEAGYNIGTLLKRLSLNCYDALMVIKDIEHLESKAFLYRHFGIAPYDFKKKPK